MPDIDASLIKDLELDAERLELLFGKEANYGKIAEDAGDGALFPDGTRWSTCSNWAQYARRVLGDRAAGLGFFDEENPESAIAQDYGGHDFVLVDGRFIVDGWVREVAGMSRKVVFDLEDPTHAAEIKKLYGDRSKWETSGYDPKFESPKNRETAMSSSRFQEIIDTFTPAYTLTP